MWAAQGENGTSDGPGVVASQSGVATEGYFEPVARVRPRPGIGSIRSR